MNTKYKPYRTILNRIFYRSLCNSAYEVVFAIEIYFVLTQSLQPINMYHSTLSRMYFLELKTSRNFIFFVSILAKCETHPIKLQNGHKIYFMFIGILRVFDFRLQSMILSTS